MSLTAAFTVLGGVGTTCVALAAERWEAFSAIAPYKWLYILFVILTIGIGVMGIRAVILLVKGKKNAYRYSLIALVSGVVVGGIHMAVSRSLRGSSMPVDGVVYTTLLTLALFLIYRIPGVWKIVNFSAGKGSTGETGGGLAAIVMGGLTLSIQFWMAPTHTFGGVNYSDAFHLPLVVIGIGFILLGVFLLARAVWNPSTLLEVDRQGSIPR